MDQANGWTGFSDDDLQRLKSTTGPRGASRTQNVRRGGSSGKLGSRVVSDKSSSLVIDQLSDSQRLSKPAVLTTDAHTEIAQPARAKSHPGSTDASQVTLNVDNKQVGANVGNDERRSRINERSETCVAATTVNDKDLENLELDESKILSLELVNMEKFREQQKMMEELNKKKKAMLTVAIQERQKKAKHEAVKLSRIKQELDKLDQMVVSDISVIRNKIEEASREYLEAQKRYDKAEKEFIESKLDLHKKEEMKDQLTEHLYTVIHQNEQRKAKKLTELMDKLEMEDSGLDAASDELVQEGPVQLPPVCLISPVETKRRGCIQSIMSPAASSDQASESGSKLSSDGDDNISNTSAATYSTTTTGQSDSTASTNTSHVTQVQTNSGIASDSAVQTNMNDKLRVASTATDSNNLLYDTLQVTTASVNPTEEFEIKPTVADKTPGVSGTVDIAATAE